MIDFNNASYLKLHPVDLGAYANDLAAILLPEEKVMAVFQGIRDGVVFTDKRVIAINVQGVTGRKRDFTSLPFARVQAFSVESAGVIDLDSELEMWFSGLGCVRFEFTRGTDARELARLIASQIL